MTRPDGTPVNAVFGFTNMLAKLLKDHVGTHFAVIFDAGRLTFRNRMYEAYKAQRPEPPEELRPQFALVREATDALGVPAIELADWEADDLIASYARAAVAGFLRTVGRVGLLALRGRQAGVIRRLAWRSALGFQFGQARGQAADLPGLRLDLRMLRQDQGDQVVVGQGEEGCAVHASP